MFRLMVKISYQDSTVQSIVSTTNTSLATWKVGASGTLRNSIYLGEVHDARLEPDGWSSPGFDDSGDYSIL
jgi:alpha-L-rhamnosidase